jgi:hypothetical protein
METWQETGLVIADGSRANKDNLEWETPSHP